VESPSRGLRWRDRAGLRAMDSAGFVGVAGCGVGGHGAADEAVEPLRRVGEGAGEELPAAWRDLARARRYPERLNAIAESLYHVYTFARICRLEGRLAEARAAIAKAESLLPARVLCAAAFHFFDFGQLGRLRETRGQCGPQQGYQVTDMERLANEVLRPEACKSCPDAFVTIGTGENCREIRSKPLRFFQHFAAGCARQRDIQKHRVNTNLACADQLQRSRTVTRLNY
jgi:hypothetical protein